MSPNPAEAPTRARFILALWLCGMAGVLYLDRVCMGQAVTPIRMELDPAASGVVTLKIDQVYHEPPFGETDRRYSDAKDRQ